MRWVVAVAGLTAAVSASPGQDAEPGPVAPPPLHPPTPSIFTGDPPGVIVGPPGRSWVTADWVGWVTAGNPLPVLVTTAPAGTPRAVAGTFGNPATSVLVGGSRAGGDFRSGFRVGGGYWLDERQTCGLDADFFYLSPARDAFAAGTGTGIVARPFENAATGLQDADLIAFPGVAAGTATVTATTDVLGAGANYVTNLTSGPGGRIDLAVGYRYLAVTDDLTATEDLTTLSGAGAGTRFVVADRFRVENQFHGPSVGVRVERRYGFGFADVRAELAAGVSQQRVTITGTTTTFAPGSPGVTGVGGLLAAPSNVGVYTRNSFAVMPEFAVRAGARVADCARVWVGYDFAYLSNVTRAGDAVNLRVSPTQLPPGGAGGAAVPGYVPNTTDFWLQGVRVGASVTW